MERGLTVIAVCATLAAVGFAFGLLFILTSMQNCETTLNSGKYFTHEKNLSFRLKKMILFSIFRQFNLFI